MTPTLEFAIPEQDWLNYAGRGNKNGPVNPKQAGGKAENVDADQWQDITRKIEGFRKLGPNWDGLGAQPPSNELLDSAIGLVRLWCGRDLVPPVRVLPGTAGTVVFEWQGDAGAFAEVEVDRPFHADVMLVRPGQPTKHWELPDA
jgi:hypothetical protein